MKSFTFGLFFLFAFVSGHCQSWFQVSSPSASTLYGISFADSSTGASVGAGNEMVQYGTGLWYDAFPPTCSTDFTAVQCVGSNYIYTLASGNSFGYRLGNFLRSSDGGNTFVCDTFPSYFLGNGNDGFYATSLAFLDFANGFVAGRGFDNLNQFSKGQILKTTDGGMHWTYLLYKPFTSGQNWSMISLSFPDYQHGFALSDNDSLFATFDGGVTWVSSLISGTQTITGIYFRTASEGWAIGAGGALLKTGNGGATWLPVHTSISDDLAKIFFTDSLNGWLAGGKIIYHSVDAGTTWQVSGTFTAAIHDISMLNNGLGYACADSGNIYKYGDTTSVHATGISDIATGEFSVFPNPVSDFIHISTKQIYTGAVSLRDITGRAIKIFEIKDEIQKMLDMRGLAPGTYMLSFESAYGRAFKKVVKQ